MVPASNSGSTITCLETWASPASKPHLSWLVYQMRGGTKDMPQTCWHAGRARLRGRAPSQVLNATPGMCPIPTGALAPAALQGTWLAGKLGGDMRGAGFGGAARLSASRRSSALIGWMAWARAASSGQLPRSADGIAGGERQKVACLGAHQLSGDISNKLPTVCPKT